MKTCRLFEELLHESFDNGKVRELFDGKELTAYEIFGLENGQEINKDELKKLYHKMSPKYHPDTNPGKENDFQVLSAAKSMLIDDKQKKVYDSFLLNEDKKQGSDGGSKPSPDNQGSKPSPDKKYPLAFESYCKTSPESKTVYESIIAHSGGANCFKVIYGNGSKDVSSDSQIFTNVTSAKKAEVIYLDQKIKRVIVFVKNSDDEAIKHIRTIGKGKIGDVVTDKNLLNALNSTNSIIQGYCDSIKNNKDIEKPLNTKEDKNAGSLFARCPKSIDSSCVINSCTVDPSSMTAYMNKLEASFKQALKKHPYTDEITKEVQKNMVGNKYTSVGRAAYKEALEDLKNAIKNMRLFEKVDMAKINDDQESIVAKGARLVDMIYKNPKSEAWESRDFLDAVEAARNGDKSAIGYLMYKHAPLIYNTYWRNYLGPNRAIRSQRIQDDEGLDNSMMSWISIALKALLEGGVENSKKNGQARHKFSTLEGFNADKVTGKPENAFAAHFKMDLITQAIVYNRMRTSAGMTGDIDQDVTVGGLEWENGKEKMTKDQIEASDPTSGYIDSIMDGQFKDKWFDFCQDDELNSGKKCTPAKALYLLLMNKNATNLKDLAEKAGVARGTFESLCKDAIRILGDYDISSSALYKACDEYGEAKIASYLAH